MAANVAASWRAAVSPARLQGGLAAALPGSVSSLDAGSGLIPALRLRLDALQNAWNQWVIGYDFARQQSLLSRLGLGEVGESGGAVAGVWALEVTWSKSV